MCINIDKGTKCYKKTSTKKMLGHPSIHPYFLPYFPSALTSFPSCLISHLCTLPHSLAPFLLSFLTSSFNLLSFHSLSGPSIFFCQLLSVHSLPGYFPTLLLLCFFLPFCPFILVLSVSQFFSPSFIVTMDNEIRHRTENKCQD